MLVNQRLAPSSQGHTTLDSGQSRDGRSVTQSGGSRDMSRDTLEAASSSDHHGQGGGGGTTPEGDEPLRPSQFSDGRMSDHAVAEHLEGGMGLLSLTMLIGMEKTILAIPAPSPAMNPRAQALGRSGTLPWTEPATMND